MTASRLQEDPAEGSRAIVEHELARQSAREEPAPKNNEKRATGADVEHLLGEAEADKIARILALQPTLAELEQAVMRYAGADDVAGRKPRPLRGKAGQILAIIAVDDEDADFVH